MRLLAGFLLIFAAGPLAAADLTPSVLALADRPVLRGTSWAAAAAYTDGEEIFSLQPDLRLAPASALKLLTSAAALETFGPFHRFETQICISAAEATRRWVLHA